MKKLSLIGACAVILFFVVAGTPAAAPVEQGPVEYVCPGREVLAVVYYDGSTTPPNWPWEVYWPATLNASLYSDGDALHIDAYPEGSAYLYRVEESLLTADTFSIEVTAKITRRQDETCGLVSCLYLGFGVSDGVKAVGVWPTGDPEKGQVAVNWADPEHGTHTSDTGVTNWSIPNTYSLVVDKSDPDPTEHMADVSVNGTHVLSVPYNELTDAPGDWPDLPETPHLFAFGGGQSDTVWDQITYAVCGTVLSPAQQASQDIIDTVEEFNLQQGISNSLDAKLEAVLNALDDINENNDVAAINSLQAFINAVEAQRGKALTNEQADELIEKAQAVINSLSS